jgi:hypothetical protein
VTDDDRELMRRLEMEALAERHHKREELAERRRHALERPEAAAEWALEAELDAYFALGDERTAGIAEADGLAREQEHRRGADR